VNENLFATDFDHMRLPTTITTSCTIYLRSSTIRLRDW